MLSRVGSGRMRFKYAETVAGGYPPATPLLSLSLPTRAEVFTPSASRPFFEGLLPEGDARRIIAAGLGLRGAGSEFELLPALGRDCAGAVVIAPPGELPGEPDPDAVRWLSTDELQRRIDDLPRNPLALDLAGGVRMSLAGVQPKLVLIRDAAGCFGLPTASMPSTHIVKPPTLGRDGRPLYEDVVTNEHFCMTVLREAGIPSARTEILSLEGGEALVVERFDRAIDADGRTARVHQEDACQALGRLSSQKYEDDAGGVRLREVFALLDRHSATPARTRIDLFDRIVASFVLGNADLHAKNIAVIHPDPRLGVVELAPMYDVVCTAAYPELNTRMAMSIGTATTLEEVRSESFRELAREVGMGSQAARRARDVAGRVAACAAAVRDVAMASGRHRPVLDAIVDGSARRSAQLG